LGRGVDQARAGVAEDPVDGVVARLAKRQHGVVARRQLGALGLGSGAIETRLRLGRLHRIHAGVYAVGHPLLTRQGWWMAAVLGCGDGAVLSHRSAAQAWGLLWPSEIAVEVTRPRSFRTQPGIRCRQAVLLPDEVGEVDGVPVTSAFRTAFDLAGTRPRREVERVLHEIAVRRITNAVSFEELVRRHPRKRGARLLAELRASKAPVGVTRNEFEERFVALLDEYGLPRPALNATLALRGRFFEIDALWRRERLAAELDSREVHDTDDGFESDQERDRVLLAEGWRTTRITWRQLRDTRAEVAADLRLLLAI
jgi:hypothetical protein